MIAEELVETLKAMGLRLAAAESCTGGMIAAAITEVAGSSEVFDRGVVTYSNQAKIEMLGVSSQLIDSFGAVSAEVAVAMADGALQHSSAQCSIAVTGIAGPTGGTALKPVGLVHFGCAIKDRKTIHRECRFGDLTRTQIRMKATEFAINLILSQLAAVP